MYDYERDNAQARLIDYVWWAIIIVVAFLLILDSMGCSASKKIAEEATKVQTNAEDIRSDDVIVSKDADDIRAGVVYVREKTAPIAATQPTVTQALNTIDKKAAEIKDKATSIDGKAAAIQTSVAVVQQNLTQVEDKTPVWLTTLKYGLIVLALGGVIFIMWRLNLFILIESGIQIVATGTHKLLGKVMGA